MSKKDPSIEDAEDMAALAGMMVKALPEGVGFVMFLIADLGHTYASNVLATMPPEEFSRVLRRWLERYDAGEAGGINVRDLDA